MQTRGEMVKEDGTSKEDPKARVKAKQESEVLLHRDSANLQPEIEQNVLACSALTKGSI